MLSKRKSKYFKSLQLKKFRQSERLFLVEGEKGVLEVMASDFNIHTLLCTDVFFERYAKSIEKVPLHECILVKQVDLSAVGSYQTNDSALAIVHMPKEDITPFSSGLVLALEDISDPGNLGTILRVADWYGVSQVYCSHNTTDLYAPKVIQASMGSFTRVRVNYIDLGSWLKQTELPVYGAVLDGESVYGENLPKNAVLLMGSESHGISEQLLPYVQHKISIPRVGGAESLNVSVATAVLIDHFARA